MHCPRFQSLCAALVVGIATFGLPAPAVAQLDAANAASARAARTETAPPPPDFSAALRRLAVEGKFVYLPVIGRIGTDIAPEGFEELAAHRKRFRGATAIVVELESDAGSDAAARRIAVALQELGQVAPVVIVVNRAIGPAAMLLSAAHRVFVVEPAPSDVIVALQPEVDPLHDMTIEQSVAAFTGSMEALLEQAPRRDALEAVLANRSLWSLTSRDVYAAGVGEPLEGGMSALGRALRIDPWVSGGRQVEEILRRSTGFIQQIGAYRARMISRAFASLETANQTIAQMAAAEFAAGSIDPRRDPSVIVGGFRVEAIGQEWIVTPASASALQRACDTAVAAWQRVVALGEAAQQSLHDADADLGALVAMGVRDLADDPVLADAVDRLERERSEVESRVASIRARTRAAREEAASIALLMKQ